MKELWCWRCGKIVPMLDEEEYIKIYELIGRGMNLDGPQEREKRFKAAADYHKKITGVVETNPNVIMHHRISMYGPPCEKCGKPYRTDLANFCAACGNKRRKWQPPKTMKEFITRYFRIIKTTFWQYFMGHQTTSFLLLVYFIWLIFLSLLFRTDPLHKNHSDILDIFLTSVTIILFVIYLLGLLIVMLINRSKKHTLKNYVPAIIILVSLTGLFFLLIPF